MQVGALFPTAAAADSAFLPPPSPQPQGVHISAVVAGLAAVPGVAAWVGRHVLPLPVSVVLWHISATGLLVAAAATETLAGRTTGLLGKVCTGAADTLPCGQKRPAEYE